jgi:hypothetical protein
MSVGNAQATEPLSNTTRPCYTVTDMGGRVKILQSKTPAPDVTSSTLPRGERHKMFSCSSRKHSFTKK